MSLMIRHQAGKRLDGGQALDAEIRSAEPQPFSSGERATLEYGLHLSLVLRRENAHRRRARTIPLIPDVEASPEELSDCPDLRYRSMVSKYKKSCLQIADSWSLRQDE